MKLNRLVPVTAICSSVLIFASDPTQVTNHGHSRFDLLRATRSLGSTPYSYLYVGRQAQKDTVKVIAIRVAFQADKDQNTTGNGRFGIWQTNDTNYTFKDQKEREWYTKGGYSFDLLPHDSVYFSHQLDYLISYYNTVSKGNLSVPYEIFPYGSSENSAYVLPRKMALYSPGNKGDKETYTDYNLRVNRLMMEFIRDALSYSNADTSANSTLGHPFGKISMDSTGTLWEVDSTGNPVTKAVILLIHAGASKLTDRNGDSPSDLTDNFITEDQFSYFSRPGNNIFGEKLDSINGRIGMSFIGYGGKKGVISEVMMISETSNQDSLNYGTHGILVNQFARQIGIPDLYSRVEGVTGIGRFGIMDFEGYSAASGFVPPNPSAWTRLFMGWDTPIIAQNDAPIALNAVGQLSGSTMALVPINSHEYWLVENRQRNLTKDSLLFNYDTTDGIVYIQNDNSVNLSKAVITPTDRRKVVQQVKSQDIGIAGSGFAVWHIDESLISNRLRYNFLNSDPNMRGVSLEEADGVVDIGAKYQSVLGTSYGNGTADDLFPHRTESRKTADRAVHNEMTPVNSPSTLANDGGNSFLEMFFDSSSSPTREKYRLQRSNDETNKFHDYFIYNYVDTSLSFSVKPTSAYSVEISGNGPRRVSVAAPFDLLMGDIAGVNEPQLIVLDSLGRLTIMSQDGVIFPDSSKYSIVPTMRPTVVKGISDTLFDTLYFSDSLSTVYTFPTYCDKSLFIPTKTGIIYRYNSIAAGTGISKIEIDTKHTLTSPICGLTGANWVVGGSNGSILFGSKSTIDTVVLLSDSGSVQAFSFTGSVLSAVTFTGNLYVFNGKKPSVPLSLSKESNVQLYPPFSIVSGDLNGDGTVEIAVTDSRQGLFLCQYDPQNGTLKPHPQTAFTLFANDWSGIFHEGTGRDKLPKNGAFPSLSDIDGDGTIEIIIPGSNGIYVFNHRGIMIPGWPALMDRNNWRMRRSVVTSPITCTDSKGQVLTLFATPTGNRLTYEISKVISTGVDKKHPGKYVAYFNTSDGYSDSLNELDSLNLYDTILKQNDSMIVPYIMPGGMIDARGSDGKRPDTLLQTFSAGKKSFSPWPLTMGSPVYTSPVAITSETGETSLFAFSDNGYLHSWKIGTSLIKKTIWSMAGGNPARTFSLTGVPVSGEGSASISNFYTYPNPLRITDNSARLSFRYKLGQKATSSRLSIYTAEGRLIFEEAVPSERGINEYLFKDLSLMGSAPYTCRLEVTFPSSTDIKFWKMAVLRGQIK